MVFSKLILVNKNFTKMLLGYFISICGDWLCKLAIPIYIYSISKSPVLMAISFAVAFLPAFIISPIAGVIIDRFNRHKILYITDFLAAITSILILLSLFLNKDYSLYIIFPLLFILASIVTIQHPASQAFVPEIVEEKDFSKANSYYITTMQSANMFAPVIGGALIAFIGVEKAITIDALSFIISGFIVKSINFTFIKQKVVLSIKNVIKDLKEGFNYSLNHQIIKWSVILFTISNFGSFMVQGNLIFLLIDSFSLNSSQVGVVLSMQGVGAVLGALLAAKLIQHISKSRFLLWCFVIDGLAILFLVFSSNIYIVTLLRFVAIASEAMMMVAMYTLRHELVKKDMLGKVVGITRPAIMGIVPLGAVVGGYLVNQSLELFFIISAVLVIFPALWGLFTPFNSSKEKLYDYKI